MAIDEVNLEQNRALAVMFIKLLQYKSLSENIPYKIEGKSPDIDEMKNKERIKNMNEILESLTGFKYTEEQKESDLKSWYELMQKAKRGQLD